MSDAPQPEVRGRPSIVRAVLLALGAPTLLVGILGVALAGGGNREIAEGMLLGHGLATLLTASWVVGALVTFHRSMQALMVGTVGAFPIRLLVLVVALGVLVTRFEVHLASLTLTLFASMTYGFVVEGWTFNALSKLDEAAS